MSAWDDLEYEKPYPMAEISERTEAHCSVCGRGSRPRAESELTVIKHRHNTHQRGHSRIYCRDHLPVNEWGSGTGAGRLKTMGSVCETCWMAVPLSGICDNCGEYVE